MPRATINYALAATLLAQGMELEEVAPQVGAKTPESLRVGLNRKGVTVTAAKVLQSVTGGRCSVTMKIASQASEILRRDAGELLQTHVSKLKEVPARANLKHIQAVGAALEPLIRSAKIVHDWGNQEAVGMVMTGLLDEQKAIDVAADSTPTADSLLIGEPSNSTEPTANTGESVGGSNEG